MVIHISLRPLIIISVLLLIFCLIFTLRSWRLVVNKRKIKNLLHDRGVAVQGHITGRRVGVDYWGLTYSYDFQERVFTSMRRVPLWSFFKPKATIISVLCLPEDPDVSMARINDAPDESHFAGIVAVMWSVMACMSLLLIIFCIVLLYRLF